MWLSLIFQNPYENVHPCGYLLFSQSQMETTIYFIWIFTSKIVYGMVVRSIAGQKKLTLTRLRPHPLVPYSPPWPMDRAVQQSTGRWPMDEPAQLAPCELDSPYSSFFGTLLCWLLLFL